MVSDNHIVMSSTVSGLWKKELMLQSLLGFFVFVKGMQMVFLSEMELGFLDT